MSDFQQFGMVILEKQMCELISQFYIIDIYILAAGDIINLSLRVTCFDISSNKVPVCVRWNDHNIWWQHVNNNTFDLPLFSVFCHFYANSSKMWWYNCIWLPLLHAIIATFITTQAMKGECHFFGWLPQFTAEQSHFLDGIIVWCAMQCNVCNDCHF